MIRRSRTGAYRGQAAVELVLVLPLLILLIIGIFDMGRAVYAYITVNNAAREGARVAIVDQTLAHIQARAAQHAVALGVEAADVVVDFRDLDTPDAPDSCLTEDGDDAVGTNSIYGCGAVIVVPYRYAAATPIIGNLVGIIVVTGEARFPVEFNCLDPLPDPPIDCPVGD